MQLCINIQENKYLNRTDSERFHLVSVRINHVRTSEYNDFFLFLVFIHDLNGNVLLLALAHSCSLCSVFILSLIYVR